MSTKRDIENLHTDMEALLPTKALDGKSTTFNYDELYDKYSAALIGDKGWSDDFNLKLGEITKLKEEAKYIENTAIMEFIESLEKMTEEINTSNKTEREKALMLFFDKALNLIKSCVVKDERLDDFFLSLSSSITDKGEEMVVEEGALALETTPIIEEKQPSLPWIMHGCGHDDMFQEHSLMETSARIWNEDVMVV